MGYNVFVDGQEGTTGLEINDYLSERHDLNVLKIDAEKRKDPEARSDLLNMADIVFLCLPDSAARESMQLVQNSNTRIIDASTAHRTDPEWVYGLPELNKYQRELIAKSKRVSVPGCHATACVLALHPLVRAGIIPNDYPVSCFSITGYSGGGKKLIQKYNISERTTLSPKHYALGLDHKHLPEIQKVVGLSNYPILIPVVGDYYRGMAVSIPLTSKNLHNKVAAIDIQQYLSDYYASEWFIRVMSFGDDDYLDDGYFDIEGCNYTNRADLFVFGNNDQILLMVRLDNLGKGASGAAIQNMNIMLDVNEDIGLSI
ncbi:MAG: N-acetyl-gamma-glutamyl-phosphate reductase [Armatimonadota bacterium]